MERMQENGARERGPRLRALPGSGALAKFTLIELLVVVAVIAILASLLLPALQSARTSAKGIACVSNLKQQGSALWMYAGDYNCFFPMFVTANPPYISWPDALSPYTNGKAVSDRSSVPQAGFYPSRQLVDIWHCPLMNFPVYQCCNYRATNSTSSGGVSESGFVYHWDTNIPRNTAKIPSGTILVLCGAWDASISWNYSDCAMFASAWNGGSLPLRVHRGGSTGLSFDGSARILSPNVKMKDTAAAAWVPCN